MAARRHPAQLDLFDWKGPEPAPPPKDGPDGEVPVATLPDEALVAALADAKGSAARALADEAGRHGMDIRGFIADTVQRFMGAEDSESWTTIIGNVQRADDPGYAFIEVYANRLIAVGLSGQTALIDS